MQTNDEMTIPRLLTKRQLQEALQIGVTTVWEWMNEGMPYYRRGHVLRFDWKAVVSWLETRTMKEQG
ncbi:MAG TPA: helix-turn-helix domain-containing protein [Ktedonosporobacter sp.]|nr:helix-turn-helix domain-containing protein [Ktedonosporobacter sp.]